MPKKEKRLKFGPSLNAGWHDKIWDNVYYIFRLKQGCWKRTCYSKSIMERVQKECASCGIKWPQLLTRLWITRGSDIRESSRDERTWGQKRRPSWSCCAKKIINIPFATNCWKFLHQTSWNYYIYIYIYKYNLKPTMKPSFKCAGRSYSNLPFKDASTNWSSVNVPES